MAQEIKTLAQVAEDIENGNNLRGYYNNDGAQIKAGQFGSFADFISYYNQHYRPILQAIADGDDLTAQPAQLLRFMASDLLELFADTDEDTDSEDDSETAQDIESDEDTPAPFFTPGTRYRCIKEVRMNARGRRKVFRAGSVYEQTADPTAHFGWLTNEQGDRHAWPQPAEIPHELETWPKIKAENIDPRNYFEAVTA